MKKCTPSCEANNQNNQANNQFACNRIRIETFTSSWRCLGESCSVWGPGLGTQVQDLAGFSFDATQGVAGHVATSDGGGRPLDHGAAWSVSSFGGIRREWAAFMNEKHTNTESKRHKKQPKIKNKTHTNIQSSTPTIKSNNPHRKKTKKPEKETLY